MALTMMRAKIKLIRYNNEILQRMGCLMSKFSPCYNIHTGNSIYRQRIVSERHKQVIDRNEGVPLKADVLNQTKNFEEDKEKHMKQFRKYSAIINSRTQRQKHLISSLEGVETILSAIRLGIRIDTLYYAGGNFNLEKIPVSRLEQDGTKIYHVQYDELRTCLGSQVPEPVLGICSIPKEKDCSLTTDYVDYLTSLVLICDNMRDPENLSTLIKAFLCTGGRQMILTKGCVDVWDPKIIRSAQCSQFVTPVLTNATWNQINKVLPQNAHILLADNNLVQSSEKGDGGARISSLNYSEIDYTANKITALVIGGETEGLCKEARDLCRERNGSGVTIPMLSGIDSLNASIAGCVIMYEILRQRYAKTV